MEEETIKELSRLRKEVYWYRLFSIALGLLCVLYFILTSLL